ncbi:MAG: sulfatase-like hydrolase/transferase, partial [Leptospiraceae bacterium]|nr:sulfatase-like hydrolase/transferase [Leptospiraceae bacterium]
SVIILTGDHGESLYEDIHGQGHGEHLRGDAITRVPLFIKLTPDWKNKATINCELKENCNKFNGVTSSIDIVPTILSLYSIEKFKELPGRTLFPIPASSKWEDDRKVYAETGIWFSDIGDHFFQKQRIMYPNILKMHRIVPDENYQIMITDLYYRNTIAFAKHRALISDRYKFIYIPTHDGVVYEFYDRINDPNNTKNLHPSYESNRYLNELIELSKRWENSKVISEYIIPEKIIEE